MCDFFDVYYAGTSQVHVIKDYIIKQIIVQSLNKVNFPPKWGCWGSAEFKEPIR
jgi:hypothetical protein